MPKNLSLKHKIALGIIPRIGDINARKLVSHLGSVEAVFSESYRNLIRIPGIGSELAKCITERSYLEKAEQEALYVTRNNIRTYFYLDDDYPSRLRQCEDSPVMFFLKGSCDPDAPRILSVVGTRNSTSRGREICEKIIGDLAADFPGLTIVSGLAYGIDITSHKAALANNLPTIAVLGHGLNTIYPSVHRPLAGKIAENGGLLTDFLSDTLPERNNFIKRNRIIAGISDATLIIESGKKGGALITADIAGSYNRDVLAVPGRPGDIWSAGCNSLIKYNRAALVESAGDVKYFLNWQPEKTGDPQQKKLFPELGETEKSIYDLLSAGSEMTIDSICRSLDLPVFKLSAILLQLELKGLIKNCPGNIYRIAL
ncbi:MAG TPA: DNA-processing protein DprA [Bacteroidales bacterium]|jgi:DNA processing protein|nr:DNA-processing protein DprA [Bacteroidales bacterium]HOS72209.1 DNA-processing protein DprA [Bacteroidales bacterium]HQH24081.1 DNA-processing protein DprA [Bacteroidales bacterium]HQJ83035.1 DNA-processing protein DprA [Bacteroidales bacterium]